MELVIASLNTHKVQELREAFKTLAPHIQILSLFDFPSYKRTIPEHVTFVENAQAKALHAASEIKKICIADDSGIIVPALQNKGGELRRYQNDATSPVVQTKKLLEEMRALKDFERHAYLECCLAVATPEGVVKSVTQRSEGYLTEEERGKITFEFDTLFIKHDYSKTLGELTPSVKSRISHRRKALEKLLLSIEQVLR
ncbi:MAG: nucleoside-triphosphatase [Chlamydiia bacterium]|nr:nucleoside-triphosphatase [Chlamydiia bacterium]